MDVNRKPLVSKHKLLTTKLRTLEPRDLIHQAYIANVLSCLIYNKTFISIYIFMDAWTESFNFFFDHKAFKALFLSLGCWVVLICLVMVQYWRKEKITLRLLIICLEGRSWKLLYLEGGKWLLWELSVLRGLGLEETMNYCLEKYVIYNFSDCDVLTKCFVVSLLYCQDK